MRLLDRLNIFFLFGIGGSLSYKEKLLFLNCGFQPHEVRAFNNIGDIDIKSQPFQEMLKMRSLWITDMRLEGYSEGGIKNLLAKYYKSRRNTSPLDFIRVPYKLPKTTLQAMKTTLQAMTHNEHKEYHADKLKRAKGG